MNKVSRLCILIPLITHALHSQAGDKPDSVDEDISNNPIEEVLVYGRAQQFYLEKETTIGTKTPLSILDLPQSAQILTGQLIRDQAARDITDLYRSIAGVSEFSYSGVTIRGFRDDDNVFYDGVRGDPYSGFGVPQLFNVERVEILKGPASALYGGGEPGGMINYVTKKPSFESANEASFTGGTYDRQGGSIDSTGALTEHLAYRLGAFYEQQDSFRDNANAENLELSGGLTVELSTATKLTGTFDYIEQDLGGNRLRGVPVDDGGNFLVDRSYNANEKSDFQNMEASILQATLEHQFSEGFQVSTTLRYLDNEREQQYHESRSWVDVNGDGVANIDDETIKREFRDQYRANEEVSLTADFVYAFDVGSLKHQLLFGADYHDVDTDYDYKRARYESDGVGNLNIFNPNYGETDSSTYNLVDRNADGSQSQRYSFYTQDNIRFGEKWSVLAGVRYDHFKDTSKANDFSFEDSAITPRVGVVFKPIENTSVYLNYSESFNPVSLGDQETVAGDLRLESETGKQIELGFKSEWFDGRIMSTLAVYQIDKENIAMTNPDYDDSDGGLNEGIGELINIGEVKSRGAEWTLVGDLTDSWTVTANYAYNDTQVVEGAEGDFLRNTFDDGSRFTNAPRHQTGIWTRYDFHSLNSSIAFGADYVSEQNSLSGQTVKPFTVYDMSWSTQWDRNLLQVNVRNLFDKEYAVSGFTERNGHFPGDPREFIVQLTHSF